jgi:hypothetical protein
MPALVYWVTPDGLCIPLVASGVVSEGERNLVFPPVWILPLICWWIMCFHTVLSGFRKSKYGSPNFTLNIDPTGSQCCPGGACYGEQPHLWEWSIAMRRQRFTPFTLNQVSLAEQYQVRSLWHWRMHSSTRLPAIVCWRPSLFIR